MRKIKLYRKERTLDDDSVLMGSTSTSSSLTLIAVLGYFKTSFVRLPSFQVFQMKNTDKL